MQEHISRQGRALQALLLERRVAALATLNDNGAPSASMVPFAIDAERGRLVLHVSALAAHTGHMARDARVGLLVCAADRPDAPVHDLARLSLEGRAETPAPDSPEWRAARSVYLARFPDAEPMTALRDFRFVTVTPHSARQISGFGSARAVDADELHQLLRSLPRA